MSLEKNDELKMTTSKKKSNKGPYLLGEALGEGAFAKVRLATQIHIKEKCAIKIVDKRLLENAKDIQRLKVEIKILKSIRHKNIIQLFDIMESKTNLYFVLEYCKGGELFDYIVKNKRLKEGEACIFFQQIIDGVEYLHNQGIIHRDLKPENLLLDYKNNIKISDFGLSTFFSKNNFLQTACGTPFYAPPEMLEGLKYNGEASDIWSCGIILYAMLCGSLPFSESKEEVIVKKIKAHDYIIPNYLSKEARDMLYHILKINPEERFTIEDIKQHPWFNLIKPHLMKGISINKIKIPVDDNILNIVQEYGFDKEECRRLLLRNKFCSLTSIYYLTLKKYVREGGKSISDLESDLFEEYINDTNNYIQQDDNEGKAEEKKENNNINNNDNNKELEIKSEIKMNNINNNEEVKENKFPDEKNEIEKGDLNKKIENVDKNIIINKMNKDKINLNKNEPKTILIKINQPTAQKKQNTKTTKNKILINQNNQQNNKNIKNNVLIQDNTSKLDENTKNNNNMQIESKNKNINPKINSPTSIKTKAFINLNQQNNINTISMKKKVYNKKQNNFQNKLMTEMIKSPDKLNEKRNKINNGSFINSFFGKNKSLEKENHYTNKIKKMKSNKNIKNNKTNNNKNIKNNNQKRKNIIHSNTITNHTTINNINLANNINKISSPQKNNIESTKIISQMKEAYKKLLFPSKQNEIDKYKDKDLNENQFIEDQKPLNIINYIAKKLVSSSFCGNFDMQYSSNKKLNSNNIHLTSEHDRIISNGNLYVNKEINIINEANELNEKKENSESNTYNDNYYFKNLISILNQKFKKYASNITEQNTIDEIQTENINLIKNDSSKKIQKSQKQNIITISNKKNKKITLNKPYFLNNNNIANNNTTKNIYTKKIKYREDSDFISLDNKKVKNVYKDSSPKDNNTNKISYNIKDMTSHYNNFLDISTNYDPGIDSRGGSSVERTDSINKNKLKNISINLDKKIMNKDVNYSNDKNKMKIHNVKNYSISDNDKFDKNKFYINNKTNKNKYIPIYEKKVSINLSNTFNGLSKSENKNKKF